MPSTTSKIVTISHASDLKDIKHLNRFLQAQKHAISKHIYLKTKSNTYVNGYLLGATLEEPDFYEIADLTRQRERSQEATLTKFLSERCVEKNTLYVYLSPRVCYLDSNALEKIDAFCQNRKHYGFVFPCTINSERTLFLHQCMGHIPSWLFKEWDCDYIDCYDMEKNIPAKVMLKLHERFLDVAEKGELHKVDFGEYILQPLEKVPTNAFAWRGEVMQEINASNAPANRADLIRASKRPACFLGSAVAAQLGGESTPKELQNREDLLERYRKLSATAPMLKSKDSKGAIVESSASFPLNSLYNIRSRQSSVNEEIKFIITTHISSMNKAAPVLLKSLVERNRIPKSNIIVVVGGSAKEDWVTRDGIVWSYVTHNSYDHTALIDVLEKDMDGDLWFNMHDTCEAGENFYQFASQYDTTADHVCVLRDGWLNMGLFKRDFMERHRNYILGLKDCDKMQAILSETVYGRMGKSAYWDTVPNIQNQGIRDVYSDGGERLVMYFPLIDLYKYQSYHFCSDNTRNIIKKHLLNLETL